MAEFGSSVSGVLEESLGSVLHFPVWWYSTGLIRAFTFMRRAIVGYARSIALSVWVKNIFTPMFGRYDWQSRLISVFMRVVNIVGRSFVLVIFTLLAIALFVAYIAVPALVVALLFFHLVGVFVVLS